MGFSNVRKPERGQTELPDVCLQQDAWFKVNADAWKHCIICLVDAEQSLVFFQKSADNDVDIKVWNRKPDLVVGLHDAEVCRVQDCADIQVPLEPDAKASTGDDAVEMKKVTLSQGVISIKLDSDLVGASTEQIQVGLEEGPSCEVWTAALQRATFPPGKCWSATNIDSSAYAINQLECKTIGKVSEEVAYSLDRTIETLHLENINTTTDKDGNYIAPESIPLLLRKKLFGCTLSLDRVQLEQGDAAFQNVEQLRLDTVAELLQFVGNTKARQGQLDAVAILDLMEMLRTIILRPLNLYQNGNMLVIIDGQRYGAGKTRFIRNAQRAAVEAPNWNTLSLAYEILLEIVSSNVCSLDTKKRCLSESFCRSFLQLFASRDPRERGYVKSIVHCLYSKLVCHRVTMRSGMMHTFLDVVYASSIHNGIAEMLEIFGSIVSGFAVPLKEEHKTTLIKCVLPLHSVVGSEFFHEQLSFVVQQYVSKDPDLILPAISALLRYWPSRSAAKQILFLGELGELISRMEPMHFEELCPRLMRRLCECISGPHFQVAEYAMGLLNNNYLYALIFDDPEMRERVLPALSKALESASRCWNLTVKQIGKDILDFVSILDDNAREDESVQPQDKQSVQHEQLREDETQGQRQTNQQQQQHQTSTTSDLEIPVGSEKQRDPSHDDDDDDDNHDGSVPSEPERSMADEEERKSASELPTPVRVSPKRVGLGGKRNGLSVNVDAGFLKKIGGSGLSASNDKASEESSNQREHPTAN